MSHPESTDDGLRKERLERRRRRAASQQQTNIAITVGGAVLALAIVVIILISSRSNEPPPEVRALEEKAEAERLQKLLPKQVPTVLRRKKTEDELEEEKRKRLHRKGLTGKALRGQIDKEYHAALRRSRIYRKRGEYAQAIETLEQLSERYDDEELRLRVQPELDELLEQARDAFADAKRHAESLVRNHEYRAARKHLLDFVATCGMEAYAEEARELGDKFIGQRAAYLAQHYRESIEPIDALVPQWKITEALDQALKLSFEEPEYKDKHARRVAELRALVELQTRMIDKINRAMPRVSKRAIRAPGMAGEMSDASVTGFKAETSDGREEQYTWDQIGPEAVMRLALLCGDQKDPQHRLAVARFLTEVGHLKRARIQLNAAKNLGADIAADAERLSAREAAMGEGG